MGETENGTEDIWAIDPALNNGFPYLAQLGVPATEEAAPPVTATVFEPPSPNPFNPQTTFRFSLPQAQQVRLGVFNIRGQRFATLLDQRLASGSHEVVWDAERLPSGVYLARMQAGSVSRVRRVVLMK